MFEIIEAHDRPSLDMPPMLAELQGLQGGLGYYPVLIGGVAAAGALAAWLNEGDWSAGTYNSHMRMMSDTFKHFDALGWKIKDAEGVSCWHKHPEQRKQFKRLWIRFGKHYAEHGSVGSYSYLSDNEEGPARGFMLDLQRWATFLEKACQINLGPAGGGLDVKQGDTPSSESDKLGNLVKWGAIGIGGIVLLNVITGLRGAFPQQPRR